MTLDEIGQQLAELRAEIARVRPSEVMTPAEDRVPPRGVALGKPYGCRRAELISLSARQAG